MLDEAAEGFCVAECFTEAWGWTDAGAQLPLVVAAGEVIQLTGSLVIHFFTKSVCIRDLVPDLSERMIIVEFNLRGPEFA